MNHHFASRCLVAALLACANVAALAEDVVIFDQAASRTDRRRDFSNVLLRAVMERTTPEFGPYRIEHAPAFMERPRLFEAIKAGVWVNVTAYSATPEWVQALRSVPIPIDMGLQSWRIALIDAKTQARLNKGDPVQEIRRMRAGVGASWVSLRALEENGFPLVAGGNYEGLFSMLAQGRFDYFPRGINEVFGELETYRRLYPNLVVEERLLFHTQIPALFFVAPNAERLHRRISTGMEALLQDGSLERMVLDYNRRDLLRARLCGRIRIELPDRSPPLLPSLARRDLWIDPFDPRHGICAPARPGPAR